MTRAALRCASLALAVASLATARAARADDAASGHEALRLGLALGAASRHVAWRDDLAGALRPYDLAAAPAVAADLEWYPAARFTRGPESAFGLAASGERLLVGDTRPAGGGPEVATSADAWSLGVRIRVPLGASDATLLADRVERRFVLRDGAAHPAGFPSVDYVGWRGGARVRWAPAHARFALEPLFALVRVDGVGGLTSAEWFPRATTWGLEASLRASWVRPGGLEPFVALTWRRFVSALSPEPGDALVAGGARDDTLAAWVGVAWRAGAPTAR